MFDKLNYSKLIPIESAFSVLTVDEEVFIITSDEFKLIEDKIVFVENDKNVAMIDSKNVKQIMII